jgi:hypothetical protein
VKTKTKSKKNSNKKKTSAAKPKTAKPKVAKKKPEETMDRATLKGIAGQLKGAGADIKVLKSDTDEALQRKVNDALQRLPSADVLKKLESIDPNRLTNVLKRDCLGIFVDFSDVSCVRCPDAVGCVSKFIGNLKDGMASVQDAVATVGDKKPEPKAEPATAVTRYEPKRLVFIRDRPNPNTKGDDYYDTIQRVLDDQPENLGELRAIVEQDFDLDGDGDFMKFVTALRDPKEGIIKLDVDLSDADKVALRKAGYKV